MSFSIFSQGIKPKVQVIGKDIFFCFTVPQSKIVARGLQKEIYNDSILAQTECELEALKEQKVVSDTAKAVLKTKIENQTKIMRNQEAALQTITNDLQVSKKRERNQRLGKRLFAVTTFILLGFAILK
jgi:23S rRNA U2552 (ribose-2'-O)-methylase RlmE/FtsJ